MPSIEQRLTDLEKSVAWWRGLSLTLALLFLGLTVITTLIGRRALLPNFRAVSIDVQTLRAKRIEVVNDQDHRIITMQESSGGGVLAVSSSKPDDHDVLLFANPRTATIQISHQQSPRPFGLLTLIDRKPALQVYQESPGAKPAHFHQFPTYTPTP